MYLSCGQTYSEVAGSKLCLLYDSDPIDATTIAWQADDAQGNGQQIGAWLVGKKLSADGASVEDDDIKVHKGIAYVNCVQHKDASQTWDGFASMTVSPVELVGAPEEANMCFSTGSNAVAVSNHDAPSCGSATNCAVDTGATSSWQTKFVQLKLLPSPTLVITTTTHPTPWETLPGVLGGFAGLMLTVFGLSLKCGRKCCGGRKVEGGAKYAAGGADGANAAAQSRVVVVQPKSPERDGEQQQVVSNAQINQLIGT